MERFKRNIFLFGAGAIRDWDGPKTSELTDSIVEYGFKAKDGKTITFHIKQILEQDGHSVNFETILSVIEELIIFYSGKGQSDSKKSFLAPFLSLSDLLCSFLNYSVIGNINSSYSLNIPDYEISSSGKTASHGETPNQFFFESLLNNLHTLIGNRISRYNFHTQNKQDIIESTRNKPLNDSFSNWIRTFIDKQEIVRLYTLNYDRLNKVILENRGIDVFEGFDSKAIVPYSKTIPPNLKRIITDTDCLCNYNLHGCINWRLVELNNYKNYLPVLKAGERLALSYYKSPLFEVEKGKPGVYTNIIAGYQKAQRSVLSPYRQMQASFDKDCFTADNIFIIGYSFNDEHINESIRMALIYNKSLTIQILDCDFLNKLKLKYFSEFTNLIPNQNHERISENVYSYGNTFAYIYKFKDFLLGKIKYQNE